MQRKLNQRGFGTIELLLTAIVVLLAGFIGYYVWHTQKSTDKTFSATSKSAQLASKPPTVVSGQQITLKGGLASFNIPKSWSSTQMAGICQTDNPIVCVASSEVSPVDAQKAQAGDAFGVDIALIKVTDGKDARAWYFDDYLQAIQTSQYEVSNETINGYQTADITETTNSYFDVSYVLRKGDSALIITSRVSSTGYSQGGTSVTQQEDDTQYIPEIKQIVMSVHMQ